MSSLIYQTIYSIYIIRNLITNMIYVGFTVDLAKRRQKHISDAFVRMSSSRLHRSMRKYGIENFTFEIIYQSLDGENCLREWEPYFIQKYNSFRPNGYNLTLGGDGCLGYKHTREFIQKISILHAGVPKTEESKQKNREAHLGKKQSEETIRKKAKAISGTKHYLYGKHPSEESKQKNKIAHLGKKRTEEAKKNQSIAMTGKDNPMYGKSSWSNDPIKNEARKQKQKETWRKKREAKKLAQAASSGGSHSDSACLKPEIQDSQFSESNKSE